MLSCARPSVVQRGASDSVAKRIRGNRSTHRPGGQGPSRTSDKPAGQRTDEPGNAGTVALRAQVRRLEPRAADPAPEATPVDAAASDPVGAGTSRSARGRVKVKPNSLLAARAATEYVYVGQDLKRITWLGVLLFLALLAAWVLLVPLDLAGIY